MKKPRKQFTTYALLHLAIFIFSLSTICAKNAAKYEFLSFDFCLLYAGVILALGIYAIIWQQVLKKIPLTNAFVNKSATLIWSLLWGVAFFGETISLPMITGIFIVFIGVILVITGNSKTNSSADVEKESPDE